MDSHRPSRRLGGGYSKEGGPKCTFKIDKETKFTPAQQQNKDDDLTFPGVRWGLVRIPPPMICAWRGVGGGGGPKTSDWWKE